jgi:hypothetical protein
VIGSVEEPPPRAKTARIRTEGFVGSMRPSSAPAAVVASPGEHEETLAERAISAHDGPDPCELHGIEDGDVSEIRDILDRHRRRLMELDGVVGVAVGRSSKDPKKLCVLVYTTAAERPSGLPAEIEGYEIEVRKTSGFRAR